MLAMKNSFKLLLSGSIVGVAAAFLLSPASESFALQNEQWFEEEDVFDSYEGLTTPSVALGNISISVDEPENVPLPEFRLKDVNVQAGDTLEKLLHRAGVDKSTAYKATKALSKVFNPRYLKPGQKITLSFTNNDDDEFTGLTIEPRIGVKLSSLKDESGNFISSKVKDVLTPQLRRFEGTIRSNLLSSAVEKGVPRNVVHNFARLFSNSVDFQKDIRPGDSFQIMYEQLVNSDGEKVKTGKILFASLTLKKEKISLYEHTDKNGYSDYYDETGQSIRKALSRRPLNATRISAKYGMRRHPILRYKRMHWGVDYAAPSGTPIYAAGDGIIEHASRKGSYGKYIRIRHNSSYQTAYAHLRRYAKSSRRGKRVKKGQVIGYVGSTGRSTGPHLHYEIIKEGRHVNPLKTKIAAGRKLKGKEFKLFASARKKTNKHLYSYGISVYE